MPGISRQGRTGICIFDGIMDAIVFCEIIQKTLLPFIRDKLPTSHRLLQDNDPKHTSKRAVNFFDDNGVNWWHSPPESPDANPIENMWYELKEYVRKTKPRSKEYLVWTIKAFWAGNQRITIFTSYRIQLCIINQCLGLLVNW